MLSFDRSPDHYGFVNISGLLKEHKIDMRESDSVTSTLLECVDQTLDYSRDPSEKERALLVARILIGYPPDDVRKATEKHVSNWADIDTFAEANRDPDLSAKMTVKLNRSAGVGSLTKRTDSLLSIDRQNAPWVRCDVLRCSEDEFGRKFGLIGGAYCRSGGETGRLLLPFNVSEPTLLHEYTHGVADNYYFPHPWLGVGFNEGITEWVANGRIRPHTYISQVDFVHSLFSHFPNIRDLCLKGYREFRNQAEIFSSMANKFGPQFVINILLMDTGDPSRTVPSYLRPYVLSVKEVVDSVKLPIDWR